MKTTPGPWFARDNGHFWEAVVSTDEFARSVAHVPVTARQSNEEAEQIARLIASAPDLLAERDRLKALNAELAEALELMLRPWAREPDSEIVDGSGVQIARAALKKHQGETT